MEGMPRRRKFGCIVRALLALAALACAPTDGLAQLRINPTVAEANYPIALSGGEVVRWKDGNIETLILRGGVTLEQGPFAIRMRDAVVWLGTGEAQRGKPLPVTVYGEGEIAVAGERSPRSERNVLIELKTKGDFRFKHGKLSDRQATDDPFYRRAVSEVQALLRPPEPTDPQPIQQTSLPLPPAPTMTSNQTPAVPVQTKPSLPGPEAPPIVTPTLPPPTRTRIRRLQISPRGSTPFFQETFRTSADEQATVVTGGVTIFVDDSDGIGIIDLSTDRAVIWTRGVDGQRLFSDMTRGSDTQEHIEIYLEGHVEIRQSAARGPQMDQTRLLTADQAYYDLSRNVAILNKAELITSQPGVPLPIYFRADEIRQVAQNRFEASNAIVFASRLPSDPGFVVYGREATLEHRQVPVKGLFGRPVVDATGQPMFEPELYGTVEPLILRVEDVPIFYLPRAQGNLMDPLGPLEGVRVTTGQVFGFGLQLDWDMFELLGIQEPKNTQWLLETDYLSKRGPALGTSFRTRGVDMFGFPGPFETDLKVWAIHDEGQDILGGGRDSFPPHEFRDRATLRHRQEIGANWQFLGQVSHLSDRNFLEQYFKREFAEAPNQETYAYLKWQENQLAATGLAEVRIRDWVTETNWLPRADGYIIGQSFLDRFTYFAHGSAGYAIFEPSSDIPSSYPLVFVPDEFARVRPLPPSSDFPHNPETRLGRFDLNQELNLPFEVGPFKLVPYGIFRATHYTETLAADEDTRFYGGGGMRGSIPFTRIYPDVCSSLFNLNGLAHKIVLEADYRYVRSNVDFRELPLLDRIDDDATDQARRDLRTFRIATAPVGSKDYFLATSPIFDPQLYALRRGFMGNTETLDDLQYLRVGARQRWQTKRGFPGVQHIVDWMTLDLRATWFPDADRDNFGDPFGFLEYDFAWHIGERTTLVSNGWMDPGSDRARAASFGVFLDRPNNVSFYFGARFSEPIGSAAVISSANYILSPKWSLSYSITYDFGLGQNLGQSVFVSRTGTDLRVGLGFSYDALQNNFGIAFEILPVLAPPNARGFAAVPGQLF
jgi:hypothetical protein